MGKSARNRDFLPLSTGKIDALFVKFPRQLRIRLLGQFLVFFEKTGSRKCTLYRLFLRIRISTFLYLNHFLCKYCLFLRIRISTAHHIFSDGRRKNFIVLKYASDVRPKG